MAALGLCGKAGLLLPELSQLLVLGRNSSLRHKKRVGHVLRGLRDFWKPCMIVQARLNGALIQQAPQSSGTGHRVRASGSSALNMCLRVRVRVQVRVRVRVRMRVHVHVHVHVRVRVHGCACV